MSKRIDIHERIFRFVINGLKIVKFFPQSPVFKVISYQYVKSLTSVGANDNEADGAFSTRDFIHCYTIVRKELKETQYWLRVVLALLPTLSSKLTSLIKEADELMKIVSTIMHNAKQGVKEKNNS